MKIFGKREKPGPSEVRHDPRSAYALAPLPRHMGPPASSTPLADQLRRGEPGVDEKYVVLPRSLAEQMPLPWQRQLASVLVQFQNTHRELSWPIYKVVPSREEKLVDLDEEQLAEVGYLVELDSDGELVYRDRRGREVEDPEGTVVLVSCLDPIAALPPAPHVTGPPSGPVPQQHPGAGPLRPRTPAPMNIGPQPVWARVPDRAASGALQPPRPAAPPPAKPPEAPAPTAAAPPPTRPAQSTADTDTPPRGVTIPPDAEPIDWFTGPSDGDDDADVTFGPSGDPIERPYRFPG